MVLGLPLGACLPLGGRQCLHLDPATAAGIAVIVPATGAWTGTFALPNQPSLVGADFVAQALFLGGAAVEAGDARWLAPGC